MSSLVRRALGRARRAFDQLRGPVPRFHLYLEGVAGKAGLEVGGPSAAFSTRNIVPIYDQVGSLDNCDFSDRTVWAEHGKDFVYDAKKPAGRSFFCEGSELTPIASASYDFVLSSHNLEHFANPVKALYEWKRVLRPGGALILVLPFYRRTFDHRRTPTPVAEMMEDFRRNVGEDDLSHLPDILEKHDLTMDLWAGSPEDFRKRSADNLNNRCLHHHVFDQQNSRELLTAAGYEVLAVGLAPPHHICLLARV